MRYGKYYTVCNCLYWRIITCRYIIKRVISLKSIIISYITAQLGVIVISNRFTNVRLLSTMYKMYIAFSQISKHTKALKSYKIHVLILSDCFFSVVCTINISTQMLIVKIRVLGILGKRQSRYIWNKGNLHHVPL